MKKFLCLLTAVILCFLLCLPAYGIIASDESEGIRVTVSKKGGAPVYRYADDTDEDGQFVVYYTPTNKKIPEKSGFTVDWETAFVLDNDGNKFIEGEYKGEGVYLNPSDVSLDLSPVTPPGDKAGRTRHLTVYDDDVKIYEGPSELYKSVKSLREGDEIEAVQYDFGDLYSWYYTDDGKTPGWVKFSQDPYDIDFVCDVSYKEDVPSPTGKVITLNSLGLYDEPESSFDSDPVATVPAGKEITFSRYFMWNFEDSCSLFALIDYKGTQGWARVDKEDSDSDAMYQVDGYMMINESDEVFADNNYHPGKGTDVYIEPHTIVRYDYRYNEPVDTDEDDWFRPYRAWYRIGLGDKYYWISFGSEGFTHPAEYEGGLYTVEDGLSLKLYNEPDKKSGKAGTIPSGESFTLLFTFDSNDYAVSNYDVNNVWRYVEYDGGRYWTLFDWGDVLLNYTLAPDLGPVAADISPGPEEPETGFTISLNPFKDGKFKLPFSIFGSKELGDESDEETGENGDGSAEKADSIENTASVTRASARKGLKKEVIRAAAVLILAGFGIFRLKNKKEEDVQ